MFRTAIIAAGAFVFSTTSLAQGPAGEPLQRQEFITQMDAKFQRLDVDGNGMIVAAEIANSQRAAARAQALQQNQAIFARLDTDRNGVLTSQEFAQLVNVEAMPVDTAPMMQQFDADRDGIITLVEYRIGTQANFDRIDSDRDGIATEVEMRAAGIVE